MSIPASAKAVPPDAPVVVAYLPDASIDVRIFSTDSAVRDVQTSHAPLKTPLEMLDGFQLSKNPAGKLVREVQFRHALLKLVPDEVSIKGKDVRELQLTHALVKLVPDEVLIKGKDVREVQLYHV